jgi:hypothetical protein
MAASVRNQRGKAAGSCISSVEEDGGGCDEEASSGALRASHPDQEVVQEEEASPVGRVQSLNRTAGHWRLCCTGRVENQERFLQLSNKGDKELTKWSPGLETRRLFTRRDGGTNSTRLR